MLAVLDTSCGRKKWRNRTVGVGPAAGTGAGAA